MGQVNWSSVSAKLRDWEKSSAGKQKMQRTINQYAYKNKDTTDAGGKVITMSKIRELEDILIGKVIAHANDGDIPSSVSQDVGTLKRGRVTRNANGFSVELSFGGDLSRPSLEPDRYGGVTNIIAIFNNGYPADGSRVDAISKVSGYWHGQYTFARGQREGLHFLQAAVNEFNSEYGAQYNITVQLDAQYQ